MSKARLVITAVVLEGRKVAEVAASYSVSRSWIYELLARYRTEGDTAFEPRSRRPRRSPTAIDSSLVERIIGLRGQLTARGLDAGPDTIRWHLEHHHQLIVSRPTIHRTLTRAGLVTPTPNKRPRSSYIRFEAEQPKECWQSDFTHYRLADGTDTEILSWLDDHSRYALSITAHRRVSGPIVVTTFRHTIDQHGPPASTLTDNGMVFTTRFSGGRCGRNGLETELQTLLDTFSAVYNHERPHRSLPHRATPAARYQARPKATPTNRDNDTHTRVRHDRVDDAGSVTLRVNGRLHHIGIGRTHARTPIVLLVDDLHVRVINAITGELLRDLTIDTKRDYQPTGKLRHPTSPEKTKSEPQ